MNSRQLYTNTIETSNQHLNLINRKSNMSLPTNIILSYTKTSRVRSFGVYIALIVVQLQK